MLTHPPQSKLAQECVTEFRRALSRIAIARDDRFLFVFLLLIGRFTPELIGTVVPHLLVSIISEMFMRGRILMEHLDSVLDAYTMLGTSFLVSAFNIKTSHLCILLVNWIQARQMPYLQTNTLSQCNSAFTDQNMPNR